MDVKRLIPLALMAFLLSFTAIGAEAGVDLITAVARGDTAAVRRFLEEGADPNSVAENGNSALMLAASLGHEDILKALLTRGATVNSRAGNGATTLMLAAVKGHTVIVQALLAQGADANARQERGWSALMFASDSGKTEIVLALLANGAQVDARNKDKETALILAARNGHTEIVEALLKNGADPREEDGHGWSALVRATWEGHVGTTQALLAASRSAPTEGSINAGAAEVLPPTPSSVKVPESSDGDPVRLRVTVTGKEGRLITNLSANSFKVYEDDNLQPLVSLEHEEALVSLGILVDDSHSMRYRLRSLDDLYAAVAAFLQVTNPDDEFFSLSFNARPQVLTSFTRDREGLLRSLTSAQLQGKTALRDGIYLAIDKMREARHPKQALLIISDGADTTSRYSKREVTRLIRETDVQIYCLQVVAPAGRTARTPSELEAPFLLREVASWSGGRYFEITSIDELPYVAAKIGVELRNQYILTYVPATKGNKGWRKVEVKLEEIEGLSPMKAHSRKGYYAPFPRSSVPVKNSGDSRASP